MKKIAFITTNGWMPWGGSEELWSQTALRMAGEGFVVGVSVAKWDIKEHPMIRQLEAAGCVVQRRVKRRNIFQRAVNKFSKNKYPYDWLDKFKPDLTVISQGSIIGDVGWKRACILRRIPYVCILQCVSELHWPLNSDFLDSLREEYISADRVFFVSNKNREVLFKILGTELPNSSIVRNPFKVSYYANIVYPPIDGGIRLAMVASLNCLHKGHDMIFEILRKDKWRKRQIKVILYGDGPHRKLLESLKKAWSLENIYFEGYSTDIEDIWKKNHALLLGSRLEDLPIALVEAMLCGRIPVVTDVGGNKELVEDNVNGFLAKAPTVELIDEAMERAWQRKDEWEEMGKLAAEKARKLIPADPVKIFSDQLKELLSCR